MMSVRERIVEVLWKYNVDLPAAPLDALTDAMERIISNDVLRLDEMRSTINAHKRKQK